ncbi:sulfatase [Rhodopirellula sp. MGV]|uniref:sulfatase family protein n=1 Tax=Rhodopirellula sp. MGV TaxID=2023130 RepID=UPI000B970928|nr:sulfatase [Rhodopirellula sp. MGV]OYP34989.1 heparan N-sulfatase [Rhodopirellula sp. MGV]PNY38115.1 heparan N-sulfatase [Rhodopirellula baltica]
MSNNHRHGIFFALVVLISAFANAQSDRPNILIAVSDDQSFPHASAYGDQAIQTPAFDRVAKAGVLFRNAFTPAPGCSPMRAAFLTGREIWQIREAGTHASFFPTDLPVYTNQLQQAGYHVGMTGKGWGPGKAIGWPHNPAGKSYGKHKMSPKSPPGISSNDYAANFDDFLDQRAGEQPFCFWFGATEPHRVFGKGLGASNGIDLDKIRVPEFLPDVPEVRSDIADYMYEIQWFDAHLGRMLDRLEREGLLENTLVVVTSDNGMSFPRAKANLYEYGIHMPLAISWPKAISGDRVNDDLVSLIDVTKSVLSASGVTPKQADQMPGIDLMPMLRGSTDDSSSNHPLRQFVYSGRERHSSSRFNTLGYPCRCVRTKTHLYIRNFKPERYPAGAPQKFDAVDYDDDGNLVSQKLGPVDGGYHDIDACPTLDWMIANQTRQGVRQLLDLSVQLRPAEELYDIVKDPGCLNNLIADSTQQSIREKLSDQLTEYLRLTGDLRVTDPDAADVWETYPRVSALRWFPKPAWADQHPESVPEQAWLETKRP